MSKDVLGEITLADVAGLMKDLWENLTGPNAREWIDGLKKFLRKENPWPTSPAQTEKAPVQSPPPMWEKVGETTIRVNLGASPVLPFTGAKVEWQWGKNSGWVTVERKGDELFVDDRKVILFLTEEQKKGPHQGHKQRKLLEGKLVLHPNILDALFANLHLIPEAWKQDGEGRTRYIFFWSVGYRNSDGYLFVRCLYWAGGRWNWNYRWLDDGWGVQNPAAVLGEESSAA